MRKAVSLLLAVLLCVSVLPAMAAEGDPLLSVDDLILLEESYVSFLNKLANLLIERELLMPEEKQEWINLQKGDFYSNGGYGSILTSFYPGVLDYIQEEEQIIDLIAILNSGIVELATMRRYNPDDSMVTGLMLMFSMTDDDGQPMDVTFEMSTSDGIFLKWDASAGSYVSVGQETVSTGETVFYSSSVPADDANPPEIHVRVIENEGETYLGQAALMLEIENGSYMIREGSLKVR